jgi:hypothetical protein
MAFVDLYSQLSGSIAGLSPILARKFVNNALQYVYGERDWSFNVLDGSIVCPTQITAGGVTFVQYADPPTVTLNAAASAAVQDLIAGQVPGILQMSIRFGGAGVVGQIYNIVDVDNTDPAAVVFTLNRTVVDPSETEGAYQIYRPYITAPISDFLAWESVVDMVNGYTLWSGRITNTSAQFDARDPQRQSQGLAYFMGSYAGGVVANAVTGAVVPNATIEAGQNMWELWPHPTSGQRFYARFRRKGALFVQPSDTQPAAISDSLILHRARYAEAYPYAMANIGNFPAFKGVNFPSLILAEKAAYDRDLLQAKRNDDEAALQTVWSRGHGLRVRQWGFKGVSGWPVDAAYMQGHLINF